MKTQSIYRGTLFCPAKEPPLSLVCTKIKQHQSPSGLHHLLVSFHHKKYKSKGSEIREGLDIFLVLGRGKKKWSSSSINSFLV